MTGFVFDLKTREDDRRILAVLRRWELLRLQPQNLLQRRIRIHVLNSIQVSHRRKLKQKQKDRVATVWIAGEAFDRSISPSSYISLAKRLAENIFPLVRKFGYQISSQDENERYVLYRSRQSTRSDAVVLYGVQINIFDTGDVVSVRAKLYDELKLLPESQKGESRKMNLKKKHKGSA